MKCIFVTSARFLEHRIFLATCCRHSEEETDDVCYLEEEIPKRNDMYFCWLSACCEHRICLATCCDNSEEETDNVYSLKEEIPKRNDMFFCWLGACWEHRIFFGHLLR